MATRGNSQKRYRPQPKRQGAARPSLGIWVIAVALLAGFAVLISYLDMHRNNKATLLMHQLFHPQPSVTTAHSQPDFEFYTALPSGELNRLPDNTTPAATVVIATKPGTKAVVAEPTTAGSPAVTTGKAPVTAPAGNVDYFLQVAAFSQYIDADRLKAALLMDSFNANVAKSTVNNKDWYRVVVGPYRNLTDLNQAQAQLTTLHYQPIRLQLGGH